MGVVCSEDDWKQVLNDRKEIGCQLKVNEKVIISSLKHIGHEGSFCKYVDNCRYLTSVTADGPAELTISMPRKMACRLAENSSKVVVMKSPLQTKMP